jgi:hypothetical protein
VHPAPPVSTRRRVGVVDSVRARRSKRGPSIAGLLIDVDGG